LATIYSECPACGSEGKIDDSLVGRRIKCKKCGVSFVLEIGGSYDLAQPERPARVAPDRADSDAPSTPRPPADPELERRLEQWAEE
jgi:hypothetical protein